MKVFLYFKKGIVLLSKLGNPAYFLYWLLHYLKKSMPLSLATHIARVNLGQYKKDDIVEIVVDTYDGSGQCVHPDVIEWNGKVFLTITPYPYGMEEYENPCVYSGNSLTALKCMQGNPLDKPAYQEYGYHLSDPCFASDGVDLYCAYRVTKRESQDVVVNKILWKKYIGVNTWAEEQCLMESKETQILSPAILFSKGEMVMYHVDSTENDSSIVYTIYDEKYGIITSKKLCCNNLPEDYYIWHIGLEFENGKKFDDGSQKIKGVFLLRGKKNSSEYKIYRAASQGVGQEWCIEWEYQFNANLQNVMKLPYKSCFVPGTEKILMSFRDIKDRYRLVEVE